MDLQLKKIKITHFKGVKSFEADLTQRSHIYGDNATGKTTIFDAFTWALFGKDSNGDTQFTIKPQNKSGETVPKLENEVELTLSVGGRESVFRRTHREKWVTKRGEEEAKFTGHETEYMVDEVPLKQSEYQAKVNDVVAEDVFRMITNPFQFNSFRWDERRRILFDIGENVTLADAARGKKKFEALMDKIGDKEAEDIKRELKAKIKKAKDAAKDIPARIDEVNRNTPEPVDEKAIRDEIYALQDKIEKIDEQITDTAKANESKNARRIKLQDEHAAALSKLKAAEAAIEEDRTADNRKAKSVVSDLKWKAEEAKKKADSYAEGTKESKAEADRIQQQVEACREEWKRENARDFTFKLTPDQTTCKTCGQPLPDIDADEMEANARKAFNVDKRRKLDDISGKGKDLAAKVAHYNERAGQYAQKEAEALKEAESLLADLEQAEKSVSGIREMTEEEAQTIKKLTAEVDRLKTALDNPEDLQSLPGGLKEDRKELSDKMHDLRAQLNTGEQIAKSEARKQELMDEEKSLAKQVAGMEKELFALDELIRERINLIEDEVNSKFEHVRFRMFEDQINEGIKETCVTLVGGVPFPDANNAAKINAGIDIINTLSKHYGVTAPIFIDNRESVVELIETPSQIINLYVSKTDKVLRIENQ